MAQPENASRAFAARARFLLAAILVAIDLIAGSPMAAAQEPSPPAGDQAAEASSPTTDPSEPQPSTAAETPAPPIEDAPADSSVPTTTSEAPTQQQAKSVGKTKPKRAPRARAPFTRALRFAPEDNGLSINNPQIKWEFDKSGKRINMGGLRLDEASIRFRLTQIKRSSAPARYDRVGAPLYLTSLSMTWPTLLSRTGTLSIETLEGETVFTTAADDAARAEWDEQFRFASEEMKALHKDATFGILDLNEEKAQKVFFGGQFRACLTQKNSDIESLKICTSPFSTKGATGQLAFQQLNAATQPTLELHDKSLGTRGIVNFAPGKSAKLKVVFQSQAFIEIESLPADPQLLDAVETPDASGVVLTGHGAKPLGPVSILSEPATHFWAPTGIPQERVWQITIPRQSPTLRILGAFNIPFTLLFVFERLPQEHDRVYVKETCSSGTYSSAPVIEGYSPSGARVTSKELGVELLKGRRFEWTFSAPDRGKENRARLLVQDIENKNQSWVAHHRMYRSYPFELSGRLTGIATTDFTFLFLAEATAAVWLESLGFTQNEYVSKQRWGLNTKYFKTLTAIRSTSGRSIDDFAVVTADLKYNLLPGIWHFDEIVGIDLSYQGITLAGTQAQMLGVGAYWARTMPRIFNDLFNLLPLMDYPKYVDMELIYYPVSLTSGVKAGASFNLNFHGRVFWSERVYGEAGFGMRNYEYTLPQGRIPLSFSAFYGTAGLGFIF